MNGKVGLRGKAERCVCVAGRPPGCIIIRMVSNLRAIAAAIDCVYTMLAHKC